MTGLQQEIPSWPKQLVNYVRPEFRFKCTVSKNANRRYSSSVKVSYSKPVTAFEAEDCQSDAKTKTKHFEPKAKDIVS